MIDKDFYWCYNHENLFREWFNIIYCSAYRNNFDLMLDKDIIFDCWQEAKKYALETANSEDPNGLYNIIGIAASGLIPAIRTGCGRECFGPG